MTLTDNQRSGTEKKMLAKLKPKMIMFSLPAAASNSDCRRSHPDCRAIRWRRYESLSISERYTVRPYQASVTVTVPERRMKRFKSIGSAQRFHSIHAAVYNVFKIQRHLTSRRTLRVFRDQAMLTVAPSDSRSVNHHGHGHLVCKSPINVTVPT